MRILSPLIVPLQTGQGHLTPNDAFSAKSVVRYGKAQQGDWLSSFLHLPNFIQSVTSKFNQSPKSIATGTAQVRLLLKIYRDT